mgnify:CR=1 FL=1
MWRTALNSMTRQYLLLSLILAITASRSWGASTEDIGIFTVEGTVTVAHIGTSKEAQPVHFNDQVLFRDVIETQQVARTKALFHDDTPLSVAENSRVEITEHIFTTRTKTFAAQFCA